MANKATKSDASWWLGCIIAAEKAPNERLSTVLTVSRYWECLGQYPLAGSKGLPIAGYEAIRLQSIGRSTHNWVSH